jgi:heme exporter protein D
MSGASAPEYAPEVPEIRHVRQRRAALASLWEGSMGQFEREAKRLGIELATADKHYGQAVGCFWGSLVLLGAVVAGVTALARSVKGWDASDWAAIGVSFGFLIVVVVLVVVARRQGDRDAARARALRDRQIRPY